MLSILVDGSTTAGRDRSTLRPVHSEPYQILLEPTILTPKAAISAAASPAMVW